MSQARESFTDYGGFVEKFKPKRTTDDCYTPPEVYAVVLDYVRERWGVDEADVARLFWPDDDFESFVGEGVRWHHHSPFPVSLLPPTILGDTNHVPYGLIGRMPCRNRAHLTRGCSSRGAEQLQLLDGGDSADRMTEIQVTALPHPVQDVHPHVQIPASHDVARFHTERVHQTHHRLERAPIVRRHERRVVSMAQRARRKRRENIVCGQRERARSTCNTASRLLGSLRTGW